MLFGWHCLQSQYQVDLMERHAGQFLIVNLMEKFAISKQIINQAINGLLCKSFLVLRHLIYTTFFQLPINKIFERLSKSHWKSLFRWLLVEAMEVICNCFK